MSNDYPNRRHANRAAIKARKRYQAQDAAAVASNDPLNLWKAMQKKHTNSSMSAMTTMTKMTTMTAMTMKTLTIMKTMRQDSHIIMFLSSCMKPNNMKPDMQMIMRGTNRALHDLNNTVYTEHTYFYVSNECTTLNLCIPCNMAETSHAGKFFFSAASEI